MKMRRTLFAPAVLSLLVAITAGVVWQGSIPAQAAVTWSSTLVPIKGSVDGVPETVVFSGNAKVNSRLAPDPVFNTPTLVLSIDLTSVSAVGSSTRSKYVVSGPEMVQRKVAASQQRLPYHRARRQDGPGPVGSDDAAGTRLAHAPYQ